MAETKVILCADGWEILAVEKRYPGYWGRGRTVAEAIRNAVKAGASRSTKFYGYLVPPGSRMDELGDRIEWNLDDCSFEGQKSILIGDIR